MRQAGAARRPRHEQTHLLHAAGVLRSVRSVQAQERQLRAHAGQQGVRTSAQQHELGALPGGVLYLHLHALPPQSPTHKPGGNHASPSSPAT